MPENRKVLHVVEAYGGGVETMIKKYLSSTESDFEHFLYYGDRQERESVSSFSTAYMMPKGHFHRIKKLLQLLRNDDFDVIHLHSSYAGFYGRVIKVSGAKVIYTPHCYAFLRQDKNYFSRFFFYALEKLLSKKKQLVLACGPAESDEAINLNSKAKTLTAINFASIDLPENDKVNESLVFASMGRICPQKNPSLFKEIAIKIKQLYPKVNIEFVWIGGGEPEQRSELENSSIRVTGWLKREDALKVLQGVDLYIHTAKWEGNPMTVIEAAKLQKPILAYKIPSTECLCPDSVFSDVGEAVKLIEQHLSSLEQGGVSKALAASKRVNDICTETKFKEAVLEAYSA